MLRGRRCATDAQVAEWLKAADCKSATLRVTKVRILPCAPFIFGSRFRVYSVLGGVVDLSPAGSGRMKIALAAIALLALASWLTMEPGKFRFLTWLLLALIAFRIVLTRLRSRYDGDAVKQQGSEQDL